MRRMGFKVNIAAGTLGQPVTPKVTAVEEGKHAQVADGCGGAGAAMEA
jgi:hypothetical protein